jgi:hypothetical protein
MKDKLSEILIVMKQPMTNQFKSNHEMSRNIMKKVLGVTSLFVLFLVMTACIPFVSASNIPTDAPAATPQESQPQPAIREAQVQSIEIQFAQSDPTQVNAIVRGNLSESCATLTDPQISYAANTFQIKVLSLSPTDRGCIQITTPYEQAVALDTSSLAPGTYTVIANSVSTTFDFPTATGQSIANLKVIVLASDGTLQVANLNVPLNPTARPTFNSFLPSGGGAESAAYVLDANQGKAVVTNGNGFQNLIFVQSPTLYGLAVWPGDAKSPARLAWATQDSANHSSTIKISSLDGAYFDTLLTQDSPNPPSQLMAQFFSPDGRWLYFSKEPIGIGGYILFSGGSSLYKINVTTRQVVDVIATDLTEEPEGCLDAISPDFLYVAEHCTQNFIRIRDLTSGGAFNFMPPAEITTGSQLAGSARFSPDGKKLAYAIGKSVQDDEQGWVAVSDTRFDNSKVIMTSPVGSYYTIAGWLDDQTLLVQSTHPLECSPICKSELWTVKVDGADARKAADGSFLAAIPNDAFIQLPASEPPTPDAAVCQDAAQYIRDDGMDGMTYTPNTAFTKTWTVKNAGTCTWDSNYLVYQISGAFMTQQPSYWLVPPENTVEPGQTVDIHVGMTSPPMKGNYKSYWGLKNEDGEIIPIEGGADGNSFYVEVKVNDGSVDTGAVTATSIDIVPEQGSGEACTANSTYFVHAYITTDGPTTASYEIGSTAGQIPAGYFEDENGQYLYVTSDLIFDKADTKQINMRFVGPYPHPDDITVNLRVNGGEWINTKLFCP